MPQIFAVLYTASQYDSNFILGGFEAQTWLHSIASALPLDVNCISSFFGNLFTFSKINSLKKRGLASCCSKGARQARAAATSSPSPMHQASVLWNATRMPGVLKFTCDCFADCYFQKNQTSITAAIFTNA